MIEYDIRPSGNSWAVDRKIGKSWIFHGRFTSKRAARKYIEAQKPNLFNQEAT